METSRDYYTHVRLTDRLDDQVRKASWSQVDRKPNGELHDAVFHWPKGPRKWFNRLERATVMLRRYECGCGKKKKRKERCNDTLAMALIVMNGLQVKPYVAHRIALTLARLAHLRGATWNFDEDPD